MEVHFLQHAGLQEGSVHARFDSTELAMYWFIGPENRHASEVRFIENSCTADLVGQAYWNSSALRLTLATVQGQRQTHHTGSSPLEESWTKTCARPSPSTARNPKDPQGWQQGPGPKA